MTDWTDDIKKRLEAATPGPWSYDEDECEIHSDSMQDSSGDPCHIVFQMGRPNALKNAIFLAHTPTDIKNLLEEREVLREALKRLSKAADLKIHHLAAEVALAWKPQK